MQEGYDFYEKDHSKIAIHLLIEIMAHQQSVFRHSLERSNLSEQDKDELMADINADVPALKEKILQTLYASFGKTPDL